jgi:hypothetical protein
VILLKKQKRLHFKGPIPRRISSVKLKQEPHVLSGTGVLLLIQPLATGRLIGLSLIASTLVGDHAAGASGVGVSHVLIVMADLPQSRQPVQIHGFLCLLPFSFTNHTPMSKL